MGALVGDVVELLAADVARRAGAALDLEARRAQQQLVQAPDGLGVGARVARAQRREPLARVGVRRQLGHGAGADGQRDAIAPAPRAAHGQRLDVLAAVVGSGFHLLLGDARAIALTS